MKSDKVLLVYRLQQCDDSFGLKQRWWHV